jgi:hypothetical protein
MNWERQIKSETFYALSYGGISGAAIALAVWAFFGGDRLGAVIEGVSALPFALFAAMRFNNWRLLRTRAGKQPKGH